MLVPPNEELFGVKIIMLGNYWEHTYIVQQPEQPRKIIHIGHKIHYDFALDLCNPKICFNSLRVHKLFNCTKRIIHTSLVGIDSNNICKSSIHLQMG